MLVATGHSFEGFAIKEWLTTHSTCPKTRAELKDKTLIVNWNLKISIGEWLVSKTFQPPVQIPETIHGPDQGI